jgi:ribonuclease III
MTDLDLNSVEKRLGHAFRNRSLLEEALCHRSFVNEQPDLGLRDNERLEFLGDGVLNLVVAHLLMKRHPDLKEGELSRLRANLVNESRVAGLARAIDLGTAVRLGRGELQSGGMLKNSILADAYEALVASIYLDAGFEVAARIIERHLSPVLDGILSVPVHHDYKSRLQERLQTGQEAVPVYTVVGENGPDHDKTFRVEVCGAGFCEQGIGKSKKMAEQDAARKALEKLDPGG